MTTTLPDGTPSAPQAAAHPGREWLLARRPLLVRTALAALPLAWLWTISNQPGRSYATPGDRLGEIGTWIVVTIALLGARRLQGRRARATALVISAAMALVRVFGSHYQPFAKPPFRAFGARAVLEFAVDWAVLAALCATLLVLLQKPREARSTRPATRRHWLVSWLVMIACWAPWLAIYYPGILIRDSWSSIIIGLGRSPMSNHHPVLFNLWVGACMRLGAALGGGHTGGVLVYAIAQAVIFAAGLAVVVVWLGSRWGVWPARLALAYFALDPSIAMWSITMQKDTLFVLWITLLTVLLAEATQRGLAWLGQPRILALFVGLLLCVSFSRNNGPYVAASVVAVLVLLLAPGLLRRRSRSPLRLVVSGVLALAVVFTVQGPVYTAAGVAPTEFVENAGLPMNQLGWAATYGHLTPAQQKELGHILPAELVRQRYSVISVDNLKFSEGFDTAWLNAHPGRLLSLWASALPANPVGYAKAWYGLSGGYLDVEKVFYRMDVGTKRGSRMITVHDKDLLGSALGISHLPNRLGMAATEFATSPGPDLAYSLPLLWWLSVLGAAAALLRRRGVHVLPHLPWLVVVATLLIASPLTDFRYVAAGHVALPVLLAVLWAGPRAVDGSGEGSGTDALS